MQGNGLDLNSTGQSPVFGFCEDGNNANDLHYFVTPHTH